MLQLDPQSDVDAITAQHEAVDVAVTINHTLQVLDVKGAEVPERWRRVCLRNSCICIAAPLSTQQPAVIDGVENHADLRTMPDAFEAGPAFDDRIHLGRGSFGAVVQVIIDGEPIAAKTPFMLQDPRTYGLLNEHNQIDAARVREAQEPILRELASLRRLTGHPNVVGFRGVAYTVRDGVPMCTYILMELARGNLHDRIREGQARFWSDLRDIVAGLDYIHSQGMTHRDIKPMNVVVVGTGVHEVLKITDLGLSRPVIGSRTRGSPGGTPSYMAPDVSPLVPAPAPLA